MSLPILTPYIPAIPLDGIYSSDTAAAVEVFQRQYGLYPTGVTERATWYKMQEIYRGILSVVNAEFGEQGPAIYPGYLLSKGLENPDVEQLQTDLNKLSRILPEIPRSVSPGTLVNRPKRPSGPSRNCMESR